MPSTLRSTSNLWRKQNIERDVYKRQTHIRGLMVEYLNREGFRILEANDGQQALKCLENLQVDLLITDLMMPRVNGIELITEVRKIDRDIPVLIITAKEMFEDKKMGFLAGADDYMVKPIDMDEMVLRVRALLRRRCV